MVKNTKNLVCILYDMDLTGISCSTKNGDIIKDFAFQVSQKLFKAVAMDLKREGKGAITHYPPVEESVLKKLYEYFDTNDNVKLQKVFVDIMLYFGRRGRENIHELTVSDFAATTDSDGRVFIYLTKDEQTKITRMIQTVLMAGCMQKAMIHCVQSNLS
ncbi:uncharacterized protein LOC128548430 [Mercenaria mercenaria]|uniref:uncharacterized protein LOC128548430 n=1 Tax=Mercenaria mercenaria TaxID=6596 RepID=UPI00234FA7E2|nr:uncharacterized protein LOC128548430 [Mercenaria mercenaria]